MWLNGKNIKTMQPSKKLNYKYFRLFVLLKSIEKQAYWLDLQKTFWEVNNVFHLSFFEPYRISPEQEETKPPPTKVDGKKHWDIEEIFDSQTHYKKL